MSALSNGYQYIPLANPKQEIRLLQVSIGTGPHDLTLRTYNIKDCPDYVALSYEWGSDQRSKIVCLDGVPIRIQPNLWNALQNLRSLQSDRSNQRLFDQDAPSFWTDAVCINQSDNAEKCHQVAMMGRIYRQAAHTVAWLGPDVVSTALAVHFLTDLTNDPEQQARGLTSEERESLVEFCGRFYFQRMWIVQEVVSARKIHFVCGQIVCSLEQLISLWDTTGPFDRAIAELVAEEQLSDLSQQLINAKDNFNGESWCRQLTPRQLLHNLLSIACERRCLDFHDRVYALIALVQEHSESGDFDIDYQCSPKELMIRVEGYLNQDNNMVSYLYAFRIIQTFQSEIPIKILGRVAWYFKISEVLHNLDINVIGGFERLTTLRYGANLSLTLETICWIIAGYGIDLFSTTHERDTNATTATTLESSGSYPSNNREVPDVVWNVTRTYGFSMGSYRLELNNETFSPHAVIPGYTMTGAESWECRKLLETFNPKVEIVTAIQSCRMVKQSGTKEGFAASSGNYLPPKVERAAFANLLARLFHKDLNDEGYYAHRHTKVGNFIREGDPRSTDLNMFLSRSLFSRYRMEVVEKLEVQGNAPPVGAIESLKIQVLERRGDCKGYVVFKRELEASLFENTTCQRWMALARMSVRDAARSGRK